MKIAFRNLRNRMSRLAVGVAAAALLAVGVVTAQSPFPQIFEGEMWEMVAVLAPPDEGGPVNGVAYTEVDGRLFVSDSGNGTILVYEADLSLAPGFESAAWALGQSGVSTSPVFGWEPNQLTTATVQVGTNPEQTAILVSDIAAGAHRVLAFTTSGTHLFTLGLDASLVATTQGCPGILPILDCPVIAGFINGVAMGPGAKFILTPAVGQQPASVQLIGSFAAAWSEDLRRVGGTLAYHGTALVPLTFAYNAGANLLSAGDDQYRLAGPPTAILTADETVSGVPAAVRAREPFGVTFDTNGNLYMTDSWNERLTVYGAGPTFTRRFTFGTPDPEDGGLTTIEFFQSYGIRFWPDEDTSDLDEDDGRLFVADAINNRVVVYRPNFEAPVPTLYSIFELDGIGALDGFPYGLALDTTRGRIAIGDDDQQRVWILKTPDVAAFDVQVTDQAEPEPSPVEVVCQGEPYTVRFSLTVPTVPSNRPSITGVTPLLTQSYFDQVGDPYPLWTNGDLVPDPEPGGTYGSSLGPGEVMTFSYPLLAPADFEGEIVFVADVNFDNEAVDADILTREVTLLVSSCLGDPPVITATSSHEPQLTGWTPIPPGAPVVVTLAASDAPAVGIRSIDYQILGANHTVPLAGC